MKAEDYQVVDIDCKETLSISMESKRTVNTGLFSIESSWY